MYGESDKCTKSSEIIVEITVLTFSVQQQYLMLDKYWLFRTFFAVLESEAY